MGWRADTGVLLLLSAAMIPGCATRKTVCYPSCDRRQEPCPECGLVVEARGNLEPDVTELDSVNLEGFKAAAPSSDSQRWVLRPGDVQCCAAAAAPLANVLQSEKRLAALRSSRRAAQASALKGQWLAFRSIDERNKAAARALELFYLLAEVEANRDLLLRAFDEIDESIANFDRLRSEGIQIAADQDSHELRRQRLGLVGRWSESEAGLRRLNGQLHQLIGTSADDSLPIWSLPIWSLPIWPAADLRVIVEEIDVEAAVTVGMELRPDLELLRQLLRYLDTETLSLVRTALGQVDSALGLPALSTRRFRVCSARASEEEEVRVRRRQLRELLDSRERLAAEEIRGAAVNVIAALDQVALAKEILENRRQSLKSLKQRRGTAAGLTVFDISAARMQFNEANRSLVHQVIAWRMAQVRLKESQGLLAFECGYELPTRCRSAQIPFN